MADNQQLMDEINELKADLDGLRGDISTLARTLRKTTGERAEELRETIRDDIRHGREALRRQAQHARTVSRQAIEDVEEGIGEHPFSSVATAFGVGFALAKLLDIAGNRRHH